MATQQYISKANHGGTSKYAKTPFIIAMINSNGTLVDLPYPSQLGAETPDRIMGVEFNINPTSISNNMSKVINRTQTMTGFLEEHWGEELDTLSFQGNTAAFVTGGSDIYNTRLTDSNVTPTKSFVKSGGLSDINNAVSQDLVNYIGGQSSQSRGMGVIDTEIGLTTSRRRWSVSYIQFKRLIDVFRSNGCLFDDAGLITRRYSILLSYGTTAYRGFFESIDTSEDSASPFKFTYTITFKSEASVYSYVDPGKTSVSSPVTQQDLERFDMSQNFSINTLQIPPSQLIPSSTGGLEEPIV